MNNTDVEASADDNCAINKMNIDDKSEENDDEIISKEDFKK